MLTALAAEAIVVSEFSLAPPSLDEVFLALTGHPAATGVDDADVATDPTDTHQEDAA